MIRSRLLTLGLFVAMFGAGLGCETPPRTPYEQYLVEKDRHDAAVEELRALGGDLHMRDPGAAITLRGTSAQETGDALQLLDDIMLLDSLRLNRVELTASDAAPLEGRHIRHMTISRTPLGPRTLEAVFQVEGLESLHLIDTGAGDAVVEHLRQYEGLEHLTLAYEPLTDEGVAALAELPRLRRLRLVETDASEAALQQLVEQNTRLYIELGDDEVIRGVDATR